MEQFENIGHLKTYCGAGKDGWDGYQDSKSLAEIVPIWFVDYEFNGVRFPVKTYGHMVDYASKDEFVDLWRTAHGKSFDETYAIFMPKIEQAIQKGQSQSQSTTGPTR